MLTESDKATSDLSVGPQCFTVARCHQRHKHLTVADGTVECILPVGSELYLMHILCTGQLNISSVNASDALQSLEK